MALEGGAPSGEGLGVTAAAPAVDVSALRCELLWRVDGEVRFDAGSLALMRRTARTTVRCRP